MRLFLVGVLALFLSGCLTVNKLTATESQLKEKDRLLAQRAGEIDQLHNENGQLRSESAQLRDQLGGLQQQIDALKADTVRMPSALEIQTALKNAGFYQGQLDGKMGPGTKEAIQKFQEKNGLTPDGVLGSRTWSLLIKYYEKK